MEPLPLGSVPRGSVLHSGDLGLFFGLFVFIHIRKRSVFLYFYIVLHFIITGKFYRLFFYSCVLSFHVVWFAFPMEKRPFLLPGSHPALWECAGASSQPPSSSPTNFAHTSDILNPPLSHPAVPSLLFNVVFNLNLWIFGDLSLQVL